MYKSVNISWDATGYGYCGAIALFYSAISFALVSWREGNRLVFQSHDFRCCFTPEVDRRSSRGWSHIGLVVGSISEHAVLKWLVSFAYCDLRALVSGTLTCGSGVRAAM